MLPTIALPRDVNTKSKRNNSTQVAPAPWTDKWQKRVGSSLDPQHITSVGRNADYGRMSAYADLLDELRAADPHLDGVLFKRTARVAGARWEVKPRERTTKRALAKRVAVFVDDALRDVPQLHAALLHLMNAVYHGRSAVEVVWADRPAGYVPVMLSTIHPRRLAYPDTNWDLHLYDETGSSPFSLFPGIPLKAFVSGKFVSFTPSLRGEYPTREGLGRIVQWYSLFKRWAIRDWLAFGELAGRPSRLGYYGTGGANPELRAGALPAASPDHIDTLTDALAEWTGAAWAALPDTVKVEFANVAAGYGDLHEKLVTKLDAQISKTVLGGTLTTDPGERGARSLGDTQHDEQLMIARWDARALSEAITEHLVRPMVELNFGVGAPVPDFVLDVSPDKDRTSFAQYVKVLVEAGLDIPQVWVRDELNIPEPKVNDRILVPREPVEVDAAGIPVNTDPTSTPGAANTVERVEPKQSEIVDSNVAKKDEDQQ